MHATSEESLRLRSQSGIKDLTGVEQTVVVVKHKKRLGRIRTFVPLLACRTSKLPFWAFPFAVMTDGNVQSLESSSFAAAATLRLP